MPLTRVCVYCGSRAGRRVAYREAADALGGELARRGIGLVYGGASIGLMGRIADSVVAHGGEAIGIIPRSLAEREVVHGRLSELKVVGSMHERKALMTELADGFIAMPGGLGTLEELLEVLTWAKLRFHQKPCAALNIDGYYNGLATVLAHAVGEGFANPADRDLLIMDDQPARLLQRMNAFIAAPA